MCEKCNSEKNKSAADNYGGASVSSQPIGQFFEDNKDEIAKVFIKHGLSNVPVTPMYAGMAYSAKGEEFARDMAKVFQPDAFKDFSNYMSPQQRREYRKKYPAYLIPYKSDFSDFDEDKEQEAIGITGAILGGLGMAAGHIAHNMGHQQALAAAGAAPTMPPPGHEHDEHGGGAGERRFFGLRPFHIGLIGVLVIAVVVFVLASGDKKSGGSPAA